VAITVAQIMEIETIPNSAKLIAGYDGLNREITYVTVMETPNLYELITGGEFVLSTLYTFRNNREMLLPTISKLIKHGISAIGFKPRPYFPEIPQEIIDLANECKVPLFEINKDAKYREIIKAVYAEINNYQTNLLIDVERYYQELSNTVLSSGEFDQLLKGLGRRVDCSIFFVRFDYNLLGNYLISPAIFETDIMERLETFIKQNGEIDHYIFNRGLHVFPCLMRKQVIAYLVLHSSECLNEKSMLMAKQLVTFLTLKVIDQLDSEQKILTALLDDILFKHIFNENELRERLALHGLKKKNMYRIIVIRDKKESSQKSVSKIVRRFSAKICEIIKDSLSIEKDDEVVIILASQNVDLMKPPRWIEALGNEVTGDNCPVVIGIGSSTDNAVDIHLSYYIAKNTIIAGIASGKGGILYYKDFLTMLVLLKAAGTPEQQHLISCIIDPIKNHGNNRNMLMKTLDAVIFEDDLEVVASTLHIHVNTVRYRLNRIRDLTGFDFFSAKDRYAIATAYLMYCYRR
jgi:PucR family transcriptional regulator, purine catabolism regulatory protein